MPAPMTMTSKSGSTASVIAGSLQRFGDGGDDRVQVADDAVVALREVRGVLVAVDHDDGARAASADHVLQLAGDADREVQVGGDVLPGDADVAVVAEPVDTLGQRAAAGD